MARTPWIVICMFLTLGSEGHRVFSQQRSSQCSSPLDQRFKKLTTEKLTFYEVNRDYVLQAQFQKNCELSRVDVSPRYFWDYLNPKWREPGYLVSLSEDQFREILAKMDQIASLGPLAYEGKIGTVTNATLWLVDKYQNAFLERRLHLIVGQGEDENKVSSFSIYFVRSIEGKVLDKKRVTLPSTDRRSQLKLDGKWYLVDEKEYESAVIGKRKAFRAAGPVGQ